MSAAPPSSADAVPGAVVVARSLKGLGVKAVFGIVGIPVVEIAEACIAEGIQYIGFRNEQSASYAAGAWGYLTRSPGVMLAVSGPGLVHALAGASNAWANAWPLLIIAGASDTYQEGTGAFQESPQIEAARPFCKYAARPSSIARIPYFVEKAFRHATFGRPGAVYLDIPGDYVIGSVSAASLSFPTSAPEPPVSLADLAAIEQAKSLIAAAKRPLIIVGKGAAYARAEKQVRALVEATNLPFLPTPMGKGLIPDDHPQCVGPARSKVLQEADVIVLLGARLNWMLHFGVPPRYARDVKFIQVDIQPEEFHNNVRTDVPLAGDIGAVSLQLKDALAGFKLPSTSPWWVDVNQKIAKNRLVSDNLFKEIESPMSYYNAYDVIRRHIPRDAIIASEGANTMDIGRTVLGNYLPRSRLDAGTFGTMGVGPGFAIAAAVAHPDRRVVCIEGDSAFGFSGMEVETAARHNLGIVFIIINNNGIYNGMDQDAWKDMLESGATVATAAPSTSLLPSARYELVAEAFRSKGYFVANQEELDRALTQAFASKDTSIINVMINPYGTRKAQEHSWLTRKEESKI